MWTVGSCIVYTGIRLLLPIHPCISSFFFLSNFQTIKFFVTLFSGTMRPRMLKLATHMDNGHLFISSFFFLSNFQTLNVFVILFSGTMRPRRLKLGTQVCSGQLYRVLYTGIGLLLPICPFISSIFFPIFKH